MNKEPWKELHRYWLLKHRDGQPPSRKDLDPLIEIPSLVANLVLLTLEGGSYRYTLVGTEVVKRAGVDMTGQMIGLTITAPEMRDQWRAALDMVAREQTPQLFLSKMPEGVTARYVTIMLPLVAPSGNTEKILAGCSSMAMSRRASGSPDCRRSISTRNGGSRFPIAKD